MNSLMPAVNPNGLESDGAVKRSPSKTSSDDENKPSFKETMDKQPQSRADRAGNDRDTRKSDDSAHTKKSGAPEQAANKSEQTQDHLKKATKKDSSTEDEKAVKGGGSVGVDANVTAQTVDDTGTHENISSAVEAASLESVSLLGVELDSGDVAGSEASNHGVLAGGSEGVLFQGGMVVDQDLVSAGVLDPTSNGSVEALAPLQAFKALREQVGALDQSTAKISGEGLLRGESKSSGVAGMTASTVISNISPTHTDKTSVISATGNDTGSLISSALKDGLQSKAPPGQQSNLGPEQEGNTFLKPSGENKLTTSSMLFSSTLLKGGNSESTLTSDMLTRLGDQLDSGAKPVSASQPLHSSISPSVLSGIPSGADVRVQMPVSIAFGESGWGNMIAERSALMASQSLKFAELQLDPPELGQLQVKVTVNQDQASVSFVAANAQVKEALDQTLVRLKELLEEQGLDLVNVDVSDQSSEEPESDLEGEDDAQLAAGTDIDGDDGLSEASQVTATYGVDHYA